MQPMMPFVKSRLLLFISILLFLNTVYAQTQISPRYSVDAAVSAVLSKGDTLIVAGSFYHAGVYTGGGALFATTSDKPERGFPKLTGEIYSSTPDGKGGFYIYGSYNRESESSVTKSYRIEHILPDYSFEAGFSLPVSSLFRLQAILYHNGILYAGGEGVDAIGGQKAGNLAAIDVATQKVLGWTPFVNGNVSGLYLSLNTLYITGNFSTVGSEARSAAAAIELTTGLVKPWKVTVDGNFSDMQFYKDKIILGGNFGDAASGGHACAVTDTVSGQLVQYLLNSTSLYFAASVGEMTRSGDTLFVFSTGTFDTRVAAIDLSHSNIILWKKYFNSTAEASGMTVSGSTLYVTGLGFERVYKTNMTNSSPSDIERSIKGAVALDTRTGQLQDWHPDPAGLIYSDVYTLSLAGSHCFIGGDFSHVNTLQRSGILMLDTRTDEILPFAMNIDYYSKEVKGVALADSTLYLAGDFSVVNGTDYASSVLSCNVNTGQLLSWHPAKLGAAWSIAVSGRYVFLAGGLSEPAGGLNRKNLFAINRKTGLLANWSPNPDGIISPNGLHFSKGKLYLGGDFDQISGQARNRIACYDAETLSLTDWQPDMGSYSSVFAIQAADSVIWIANYGDLFAGYSANSGQRLYQPMLSQDFRGNVNALLVKGRFVLAGGSFQMGNNPCNKLTIYDIARRQLAGAEGFCVAFPNASDQIAAMALSGTDVYIAGNFTTINGKINANNMERIRFPAGYFDEGADTVSYYPQSGGNGGDVTIHFFGNGIKSPMQVKLTLQGSQDIVAAGNAIVYNASGEMKVIANLKGASVGTYDVIVTDSSGLQYQFIKGFKVEPYIKPEITAEVIGPDLMRTGRISQFTIRLTNNGNVNAYGVPLFVFVTGNNTVTFPQPVVDMKDNLQPGLMETSLDDFRGEAGVTKAYLPMVPNIPASSSTYIPMDLLPLDNNSSSSVEAIPNNPIIPSPYNVDDNGNVELVENIAGCISAVIKEVAKALAGDVLSCGEGVTEMSYKYMHDSYVNKLGDLGNDLTGTAFDCAKAALPFLKPYIVSKALYFALDKALKAGSTTHTGEELYDKCKEALNPGKHGSKKNSNSSSSVDPNDKIGTGSCFSHYITGTGTLSYAVRFENLSSAGLPAQVVKIVDTLDMAVIDPATFQLDFFRLGDNIFPFKPSHGKSTLSVDLRPQKSLILQVQTDWNETTGVFTAECTSLDPATLQLTADAILGFLPPNIHAPEGEGAIYFSVSPKPGLPGKTVISNKALIYFDTNLPIATPVWHNVLDITAPVSKVNALPAFTADTTFTISWQGTDAESGIERYDLYYAVNGGTYQPLHQKTAATSMQFTGKMDSTYSFYSIAVDSVGHTEQKAVPDTKTTIVKDGIHIYPNPTSGIFYMKVETGIKVSNIHLYDLHGRRIKIKYTVSDNYYTISPDSYTSPGVYLLKVETNKSTFHRKIMIEK